MTAAVAIVGMACRYPDARSPLELWENVLAQRRAFRRMPPERLSFDDYFSADRGEPDRTYSMVAALIEGYEFDRACYRVAGSTFRSADLAHWLALDIAAQALSDAGFLDGEGLPRATTGVLLGNTLTGEFSRASVLRLRWPYVRRVVDAALLNQGWPPEQRHTFLGQLEGQYKAPFPPVGEETLAGGLSNTIAGRICNHFDLKGGGYTVDGACAASLVAVTTACSALSAGDLDVALAGGVDLSLDPFELVGFAKAGALAADEMRVYDARSAGFWPGEGCGFVVLMRYEDAIQQHRRIYATIRGWGVSSDGAGGITRPEIEGQLLALRRAYRRAGFGIDTVTYFEGHGTGTAVGDAVELQALSRARRENATHAPRAVIGSIKANIGHTKSAAGIAGLIKATMVLEHQLLPPSTGWDDAHPELAGDDATLELLNEARLWPIDLLLRAGVSAMGFGGINSHVVLEGAASTRRDAISSRERTLLCSTQDAELFLISGPDRAVVQREVQHLMSFAAKLARAELTDLAARLAEVLAVGPIRAAVVASCPPDLASGLETLNSWLANGVEARLDARSGVFLGSGVDSARIGFLFPGQGSPAHLNGGAWRRRFGSVHELYDRAGLPTRGDSIATEVAQPAIVTASLAGLLVLDRIGIQARVAIGHSLGELTAFYWAGAVDEGTVLRVAAARGNAIAKFARGRGLMASIGAGQQAVDQLLNGEPIVIAGLNSRAQTVISGEAAAVAAIVARAQASGMQATSLPVSHAFHSPLVAAAAPALTEQLSQERFRQPQRAVVSTVTGSALLPDEDLPALLARQMSSPVRFMQAVNSVASEVDLWMEVGPGHVLRGIMADLVETPVVSLDAGGSSLRGLLHGVALAFVLGAPLKHRALFEGRFTRSFDLDWHPRFFQNPCELAPLPTADSRRKVADAGAQVSAQSDIVGVRLSAGSPSELASNNRGPESDVGDLHSASGDSRSALETVRQLVADRVELVASAVKDNDRLLRDLHLNSIAVGQLVAEAARRLGLPPPVAPTDYAHATVAEVAEALEELVRTGGSQRVEEDGRAPSGVDSWIRTFSIELVPRPLTPRRPVAVAFRSAPIDRGSWIESRPGTVTRPHECGHHEPRVSPWRVIAPPDHPLRGPLEQTLAPSIAGDGVVVCLPSEPDERHVGLLLQAAHAVLEARGPARFVLVQHGGGGAAFARTLHLEKPALTTCVVDVPRDHPKAAEWVVAEAAAAQGYTEAHYDSAGRRSEPVLRLLSLEDESEELALGPADVLLVTGGGKGIAAECALGLARETGVQLVLMGRSDPAADTELSDNLARMAASGVRVRYVAADVTDREAVRAAVAEAEAELGSITAILHGAGTNVPQLVSSLDEPAFLRTLAPKLRGAHNVLAAVKPERLRLFVTFCSIIARTGLRGEADYAVANEWLARLTEQFQSEHPKCRCLALEWSVWSGVGMGQRLGRVDALVQQGIMPIPTDEGVRLLYLLLSRRMPAVSIVVTGRFGEPPTLKLDRPELPLLRFLEQPRVYYPGVELIADVKLSVDTDPYLNDHVFRGGRLLPAVMGLEAMAQAAMAVTGSFEPPMFDDVKFARAITVPDRSAVTVRVAALARERGRVEVVVRSEETAFQVDHFRAVCRFQPQIPARLERGDMGETPSFLPAERTSAETSTTLPDGQWSTDTPFALPAGERGSNEGDHVAIDPERDLYGGLLFQSGRFRRLCGYRLLRATECVAEIAPDHIVNWFGRYLPANLVLGDPGARDAAIHAIQACIPHATILPAAVDRVLPGVTRSPGPWFVQAREKSHDSDSFVYDLELRDSGGRLLERWEGLHLHIAEHFEPPRVWSASLLGPYLQRRVRELIPGSAVDIVVEANGGSDRRARSDRAIQRATVTTVPVWRRSDGKPEVMEAPAVSAAHAGDVTLAVAGPGPLACDIEPVLDRPASVWHDLLGPDRFALAQVIAQVTGETETEAATRAWTATECLRKAGAMVNTPEILASSVAGWVLLASGRLVTATFLAHVHGDLNRLAVAVLAGRVGT